MDDKIPSEGQPEQFTIGTQVELLLEVQRQQTANIITPNQAIVQLKLYFPDMSLKMRQRLVSVWQTYQVKPSHKTPPMSK